MARAAERGSWVTMITVFLRAVLNSVIKFRISSADLAWNCHRRLCATASRLWPWAAFHLCDVARGRSESLFTLQMVYGIQKPAPRLDVA